MKNILSAKGLTDKQLEDICKLEEACGKYEPLHMKLNWDMLRTRPKDCIYDFLCYEEVELVGFIGLYHIVQQSKEIEITGMVHPAFRRKGIYTGLFKKAIEKCLEINAERILLISEHSTVSGSEFIKSVGARYSFSEYGMKFQQASVPFASTYGITLKRADPSCFYELGALDSICFGDIIEEGADFSSDSFNSTLAAYLNGSLVGKIGLSRENDEGYIFGFAVKPELRGKGYGREILSLALNQFLSEQITTVFLEVAVENERALNLYKSCGFKEDTVYDYYELKKSGEIYG
ncbi:MAG: acetyltransferase [Eubacterium sp.]|nr:acetyltransferase [Eubacterium sp.]